MINYVNMPFARQPSSCEHILNQSWAVISRNSTINAATGDSVHHYYGCISIPRILSIDSAIRHALMSTAQPSPSKQLWIWPQLFD